MVDNRPLVQRITALAAVPPSIGTDVSSTIAIRPVITKTRFSLRLDPADAMAVGRAGGFDLNIPLNSRAGLIDQCIARLGPDEWLLIDAQRDADIIADQIGTALAGRFHALVDIGHRNVGIEVSGRHATQVLNSGCPLDLAATAFPVGAATRTLLGKAEIVLMRFDGASSYRVECWRSFAQYVHDFLIEAAHEFEPCIE